MPPQSSEECDPEGFFFEACQRDPRLIEQIKFHCIKDRYISLQHCKILRRFIHTADIPILTTIMDTIKVSSEAEHQKELVTMLSIHASHPNTLTVLPRLFAVDSFCLLNLQSTFSIVESVLVKNKQMIYAAFNACKKKETRTSTSFTCFAVDLVNTFTQIYKEIQINHALLARFLLHAPAGHFVSEGEVERWYQNLFQCLTIRRDDAILELLKVLLAKFPSASYDSVKFATLLCSLNDTDTILVLIRNIALNER